MTSHNVYVAVHGGAGQHSRTSEGLEQVKSAMKRACTAALRAATRPGADALSIVEEAIATLEDEECLNAGYGSNLTLDGTVECDAAIMDGRSGDFGSVGAVPGTKNPIKLAGAVLAHSREPDRLGRIRPATLVSTGARAFAQQRDLETMPPEIMISPRAQREWQRLMELYRVSGLHDAPGVNASSTGTAVLPRDVMQDTVGAVAWDAAGNLAAGVSSGGLLLKYSGRIGEAATYGAGCWAEQSPDGQSGLACSISGAGEHIMRAGLARTIADVLRPTEGSGQGDAEVDVHDLLTKTLLERFHIPIQTRGEAHPNAGVLLMTKEAQEDGNAMPRLWCAFTTESMAIAYGSSEKPAPKAKILRRPKGTQTTLPTQASPVCITALSLHGYRGRSSDRAPPLNTMG
ncbi:N-terminal nucleophile aminohydrolase [Gyrodon lividus]|nr:N-terminal nucleophile aminohydrolase [Gyrodon lividus]